MKNGWIMDWQSSMKTDWQKWKRLSSAEKRVLLQAIFLIRFVSLGLHLMSMKRIHAMLGRLFGNRGPVKRDGKPVLSADQIARLVRIAASRGPAQPTCLPRAMVLWALLRRHGIDAGIRFGVRKIDNEIEAHAWVEVGEQLIEDAGDAEDSFSPFESALTSQQAKTH